MAKLARVRTIFTGVAGTPWYSNLYFHNDDATDTSTGCVAAVNAFWLAMRASIQSSVTWVVSGEVAQIESTTGTLVGISNVTALGNTGSAADDALPWQTQALIRLNTDTFINGRRLRGKIFFPGLGEGNNTLGVPSSALRGALDTATEALIADSASGLVVWSRPFVPPADRPDLVARQGSFAFAQSADVSTKWSVLRSRRD
jgi:hypothetical protein